MSSARGEQGGNVSEHHYPSATIYGDYARTGFGLAVTAGPLVLLDLASGMSVLFAGLAGLFGWFGWRTALRQVTRVELSPEAIALRGPLERRISWAELSGVKLAYYAPRRGRENGWLQLTLRGQGRAIRVDSNLEGFDRILRRVQAQVRAQNLPVDPTTASNLGELGFAIADPADPEAPAARFAAQSPAQRSPGE